MRYALSLPFLFGLMLAISLGGLLASDHTYWPVYSVATILLAVIVTRQARRAASLLFELVAVLFWVTALIVGFRWFTLPIVWMPLMVVGVAGLPVVVYGEKRRRRRLDRDQQSLCVVCGYDLRASTDRCPECGSLIEGDTARRRRIADELKRAREAKSEPVPTEPQAPPADDE